MLDFLLECADLVSNKSFVSFYDGPDKKLRVLKKYGENN